MNMMAKTHEVSGRIKERLVVVGNGMAGIRTVEELLQRDPSRYDITVFGAEPHVNYNRIMLSPVLAGEKTFDQIVLNDRSWYENNNITLFTGEKVETIDRDTRTVTSCQAAPSNTTGCCWRPVPTLHHPRPWPRLARRRDLPRHVRRGSDAEEGRRRR